MEPWISVTYTARWDSRRNSPTFEFTLLRHGISQTQYLERLPNRASTFRQATSTLIHLPLVRRRAKSMEQRLERCHPAKLIASFPRQNFLRNLSPDSLSIFHPSLDLFLHSAHSFPARSILHNGPRRREKVSPVILMSLEDC